MKREEQIAGACTKTGPAGRDKRSWETTEKSLRARKSRNRNLANKQLLTNHIIIRL